MYEGFLLNPAELSEKHCEQITEEVLSGSFSSDVFKNKFEIDSIPGILVDMKVTL